MTDCSQIESLLPLFVDGEADAAQARTVEDHLSACPACRDSVASEHAGREMLRTHRMALIETAPPGLRTRIAALERDSRTPDSLPAVVAAKAGLGWLGRATAATVAAMLVLIVLTLAELVPAPSNVLFAAQVAVDHVRCLFVGASTFRASGAREMEQEIRTHYGWTVTVPASNPDAHVRLLGVRRCPWGYGPHAHLLYDVAGQPMSFYITPGVEREAAAMDVLGHVERLWSGDGRTYAMVSRGIAAADLDRVEAYFRAATAPAKASESQGNR